MSTFWIVVLVFVLLSGAAKRTRLERRIRQLEEHRGALVEELKQYMPITFKAPGIEDAVLVDERGRVTR